MKTLIIITSYNRLHMLTNLIKQLKGYDIIVYDDCSDFKIIKEKGFKFHRFNNNYGKKFAWKKFNYIFDDLRANYNNYDYYIILPDDVRLVDNFVNKAISIWKNIIDDKKICLSFSSVERTKEPCFTGVKAEEFGNVIRTQWTDLMFICERRFIDRVVVDPIDENRWNNNPNLGSGVGGKISRLFYPRFNLYNTKEELLKHIGNSDSKMNPIERKHNKL